MVPSEKYRLNALFIRTLQFRVFKESTE